MLKGLDLSLKVVVVDEPLKKPFIATPMSNPIYTIWCNGQCTLCRGLIPPHAMFIIVLIMDLHKTFFNK
jgi:hypothetical protein